MKSGKSQNLTHSSLKTHHFDDKISKIGKNINPSIRLCVINGGNIQFTEENSEKLKIRPKVTLIDHET